MSKIKNELRIKFKADRNAYMLDESNKTICEIAFLKSELYNSFDTVLVYSPIKNEPDTVMLINEALADNKKVFLPKVKGDSMTFYQVKNLNELSVGSFDILEPECSICYKNEQAVCVVPGLAFDRNGNRLGYGKGYYDKFLHNRDNIITVGFCPKCNFCDSLPAQKNDISMKYLVVDDKILKI